MSIETLPISVIIRTLNEAANIERCIRSCQSNKPFEILVVDGQSIDNTRDIAESLGVKVLQCEPSLVIQRDAAINACDASTEFVAIVDADDVLEANCLACLRDDLVRDQAQAVQAAHGCYSEVTGQPATYWEKAMLANLQVINRCNRLNPEAINMVGRPALYVKSWLVKAIQSESRQFTSASEDSDLSYRLKLLGAQFTYGTGITYRKHLATFGGLIKQWLVYGQGDAKFVLKHPERKWHVLYHQLINYPLVRAAYCARWVSVRYVPFFIAQGVIRFVGFCRFLMKKRSK